MPKQPKPISICILDKNIKDFYYSKSITGSRLKRYLEETKRIIDYHIKNKHNYLSLDLIYKLTKEVYYKGLLDIRGIYLKTAYLIIEFSGIDAEPYIIRKRSFQSIYQEFIKEWRKMHSEDALPTIKSIMTHFLMYLYFNDFYDLKELEFNLIEKYIMYMNTINKHITVYDNITKLRRILFYMFNMGYIDKDLSQFLYGIKTVKNERLPDQYNLDEITKLISSVKHEDEEGKRKYVVVLTAALLGVRAIDISRIEIDNIYWSERKLQFIQNKTRTEVSLNIPEVLRNACLDYLSVREDKKSKYLVTPLAGSTGKEKLSSCSISRIIHEAFITSDIKINGRKSYAHVLRHSLATDMINKGVTMPVVSGVLGHSSVETTKHYARISLKYLMKLALEVPGYE